MQRSDLLVEMLGEDIDLVLIAPVISPKFDLRQHLIGEGSRHDEARMAGAAAEIDEAPFGQQQNALAAGKFDLVHLRLHIVPFEIAQAGDFDLAVEMADIADDGAILHLPHMRDGDDIDAARGGDEDIGARRRLVHCRDLVTFHRRLQRADGIDLGDEHPTTGMAQTFRRALADIAEAADHRDLAGHHHVGGAANAVDQAFAATVFVVEFRFGDGIVDVDRRHFQRSVLLHFVKAVDAGRGFLGNAAHLGEQFGIFVMHDDGEIAAIVENHVGRPAVRPANGPLDALPVFFLRLALPGEDGNAGGGDGGGGMILGREDIAGRPAQFGAQRPQGLDQDGRLNGHVQAAGDARAREGLLARKFVAERHQARHFGLGDGNFLAPPIGERNVLHLVILGNRGHGNLRLARGRYRPGAIAAPEGSGKTRRPSR